MKVTIIDITPEDLAAAPTVFETLMKSLQDITLKADVVNVDAEPQPQMVNADVEAKAETVKTEGAKAEEKKPVAAKNDSKKAEAKPKAEAKAEAKQEVKPEPSPKDKAETKSDAKAKNNSEPEAKPEENTKQETAQKVATNPEATPVANTEIPTLDAMKKRVMKIKKADEAKWEGIKSLIIKYGDGKISAIPENERGEFMRELEAL